MKHTKTFLIAFLMVILLPISAHADNLRIVQFHADWCGGCKLMKPWLNEAKSKYRGKRNVEFIQLDFTNAKTTDKSLDFALKNDLDDVFVRFQKRTGLVVLVDDNQNILSFISYGDGKTALFENIEKAIAQIG